MVPMETVERVQTDILPLLAVSKLADSSFNLAVRPGCDPAVFRDICNDSLEKAKMELDKTGINILSPQ